MRSEGLQTTATFGTGSRYIKSVKAVPTRFRSNQPIQLKSSSKNTALILFIALLFLVLGTLQADAGELMAAKRAGMTLLEYQNVQANKAADLRCQGPFTIKTASKQNPLVPIKLVNLQSEPSGARENFGDALWSLASISSLMPIRTYIASPISDAKALNRDFVDPVFNNLMRRSAIGGNGLAILLNIARVASFSSPPDEKMTAVMRNYIEQLSLLGLSGDHAIQGLVKQLLEDGRNSEVQGVPALYSGANATTLLPIKAP